MQCGSGADRFGDGAGQRAGGGATSHRQRQWASGSGGRGILRGGESKDHIAVEGRMGGANRQRQPIMRHLGEFGQLGFREGRIGRDDGQRRLRAGNGRLLWHGLLRPTLHGGDVVRQPACPRRAARARQ